MSTRTIRMNRLNSLPSVRTRISFLCFLLATVTSPAGAQVQTDRADRAGPRRTTVFEGASVSVSATPFFHVPSHSPFAEATESPLASSVPHDVSRRTWIGAAIGIVVGGVGTWLFLNSGGSTSYCDRDANQDAWPAGACAGVTIGGGLAGGLLGAWLAGRTAG